VDPHLVRYPAPNAEPRLHQTFPVPAANMLLAHFSHILPTHAEPCRKHPVTAFTPLIGFQYPQPKIVRIRLTYRYLIAATAPENQTIKVFKPDGYSFLGTALEPPRQHERTFLKKKKHQDYSGRRLPGPAVWRLSEGNRTPRLSSNCFGTGREHKLNLLCGLFAVLDSKWMSGPAGMQGPPAEKQLLRVGNSDPRKWLRLASVGGRRVLHLRLRNAQQGFAPSPVQHAGQLVNACSRSRSNVQCALSQARPESSCFSLDNYVHGCRGNRFWVFL
jgi:hypothetical protein